VKSVVEKFREKYGAGDVKKYYSKFDVAVRVELDGLELDTVLQGDWVAAGMLFTTPTRVRRTCNAHKRQEYCQEQCG
jgi:hypothetical protein